jgi:hypothetical protein
MIKLRDLLKENEDEIDTQRLFWNANYLNDVAESMGYNEDFNKLFWEYPRPLFHCTTPEKYKLIISSGQLRPMNVTRGINNRSVGHSIFTTMEDEEINSLREYYGNIVIQINTHQMKKDGITPFVSKEPEVETAEKLAFVFTKLGQPKEVSQFVDYSGGISEYTVIIYGNIPVKYLSLLD